MPTSTWPGIGQVVPDLDDTEIWLESTANGIGMYSTSYGQLAVKGDSDYLPIFVPWFWQDEYSSPAPADFTRDEEEQLAGRGL